MNNISHLSFPERVLRFHVATTVGCDHQAKLANGHDGFLVSWSADHLCAVVCDGCGSCPHSEVGAKMGASFVTKAIETQRVIMGGNPNLFEQSFWDAVKGRVVDSILLVAEKMHGKLDQIVFSHFLFTIVGFIATEEQTVVFHIGDGLYQVNDVLTKIHPMAGNAPVYLSYNIIETTETMPEDKLTFRIAAYSTKEINSIMVATDGFEAVLNATGKTFPGSDEIIPDMTECWKEQKYFDNPHLLQRKLFLMGHHQTFRLKEVNGSKRLMRYPGLLGDDVTAVCARKKVST